MLNLVEQTRLSPAEIMVIAYDFFVGKHGLTLIERIEHMHGSEGAVEISVVGSTLKGRIQYDPKMVFNQLTDYVQKQYGLTPVYILLHLHDAHKDDPGHLVIQADFDTPVEVRVETLEYETLAKEFVLSLPR